MKFKIEHRFLHGWDDAGWKFEGQTMTFDHEAEGLKEIDEFFKDIEAAVDAGDLADSYRREDYRVVPVEEER